MHVCIHVYVYVCIGFEFARVGEREDKGGVQVLSCAGGGERRQGGEYTLSPLVKGEKKGKNTLSFTSPEKDFFYIFMK
jgi:hypothetical protein